MAKNNNDYPRYKIRKRGGYYYAMVKLRFLDIYRYIDIQWVDYGDAGNGVFMYRNYIMMAHIDRFARQHDTIEEAQKHIDDAKKLGIRKF